MSEYTHSHRGVALAALAAAQFMVVLDSSIVNVALPTMRHGLGLSAHETSWIVDGYLVAFAGLLLLGGRLADVLARRSVFVAGVAGFVLASLMCAAAPNGTVLVAARIAQGAAGAALAPAALSIVMTLFATGPDRAKALGVWGAVSGAGGIAGVLLGGILSETVGWPAIFVINLPIGLVAAVAVRATVPALPANRGTFDWAGAFTVTAAMALAAFGLVNGSSAGWSAPSTVLTLVGAVAAAAAFVAAERRAARPLVPLGIMHRRPLVLANAIMLMLGAVMVGMFFFLPQYQHTLGMSPIESSLAQVPIAATITAAGVVATRVAARFGTRRALVGGLLLIVGGLLWLAPAASDTTIAGLVGPFLLIGSGLGLTFVYATMLAVAGAAADEAGLASGLVNTTRQMGGALGLAVTVAVAGSGPDFSAVFLFAAGLSVVALALALVPSLVTGPAPRSAARELEVVSA